VKRNDAKKTPRATRIHEKPPPTRFGLDGLSIHSLSIDQSGSLEVEFDLPQEQTTDLWYTYRRGNRVFDVYADDEMRAACERLFQIVRDRTTRPDSERAKVHCDRCDGSPCCRKYNVLTTGFDLERLATGLSISVAKMLHTYATPAVDWSGDYQHQLAADEDENGDEKCVFLKRDATGLWRCSVYEHRPEICRNFDMRTCDDFVPIEEIGVIR